MDKKDSKSDKKLISKPPRIVSHLQSCSANDGQPVTLQCSIKCKFQIYCSNCFIQHQKIYLDYIGESSFDVMWLHNGKEIKKSDDFNYRSDGDDYILNVAEVFPEDAGIYTCEAFNDAGESFSSCSILVKGLPISTNQHQYQHVLN